MGEHEAHNNNNNNNNKMAEKKQDSTFVGIVVDALVHQNHKNELIVTLYVRTSDGDKIRIVVSGFVCKLFIEFGTPKYYDECTTELAKLAGRYSHQLVIAQKTFYHAIGYERDPLTKKRRIYHYLEVKTHSFAAYKHLRSQYLYNSKSDSKSKSKPKFQLHHDEDILSQFWRSASIRPGQAFHFLFEKKDELKIHLKDLKFEETNDVVDLRILSIDVEANCSNNGGFPDFSQFGCTLFCLGVVDSFNPQKNDCLTVGLRGLTDELQLLKKWWMLLYRLKPDVVLTYNGLGFDYEYILMRHLMILLFRIKDITITSLEVLWDSIKMIKKKKHVWERSVFVSNLNNATTGILRKIDNTILYLGRSDFSLNAVVVLIDKFPKRHCIRRTYDSVRKKYGTSNDTTAFVRIVKTFKRKKLASSAKGVSFLTYFQRIGLFHMDLLKTVREGRTPFTSYTLESVSRFYLKTGKEDLPYKKMFELYAGGSSAGLMTIEKYCRMDCVLPLDLLKVLNSVNEALSLTALTTVLPKIHLVGGQTKLTETLLFRTAFENQELVNDSNFDSCKYKGATVLPAKEQFHTAPVAVLDFK